MKEANVPKWGVKNIFLLAVALFFMGLGLFFASSEVMKVKTVGPFVGILGVSLIFILFSPDNVQKAQPNSKGEINKNAQ